MENKQIFNLYQANLFIQQGCRVVGIGLGKRGKVYVSFLKDERFNLLLEKWNQDKPSSIN